MQPKDIAKKLVAAQELFMASPTNGAAARAQSLAWKPCSPTDGLATHFDPLGAVARVCGGYNRDFRAVERFLNKWGKTRRAGKHLRHFFDHPKTTPAEVAQWFGEVIGKAESLVKVTAQVVGRADGAPIQPPEFLLPPKEAPEPELLHPGVGVPT